MNTYRTEDLALASYLLAIGFQCIDLLENENENKNNLFFIFAYADQLPTAVTLYINEQATVNPHHYYRSLKALKTLIYEYKTNGRDIS